MRRVNFDNIVGIFIISSIFVFSFWLIFIFHTTDKYFDCRKDVISIRVSERDTSEFILTLSCGHNKTIDNVTPVTNKVLCHICYNTALNEHILNEWGNKIKVEHIINGEQQKLFAH